MNLIDVAKKFGSQEACTNFLEGMRWPDGVECLKCGGKHVTQFTQQETTRQRLNAKTGQFETKKVPARVLYVCRDCKNKFSVTEGTIFNDTHLDLEKWFFAVALMVNGKQGISALQMKRELKVAYKTAWFLNHRIRKAMGLADRADNQEPLEGTVEVDETYMGAKKHDKRRKRGPYEKTPVVGMVSRDGKAKTWHVPAVNRFNVIKKIEDNISITAPLVCTDDSRLYDRMPAQCPEA